jgi:hypothetical protein
MGSPASCRTAAWKWVRAPLKSPALKRATPALNGSPPAEAAPCPPLPRDGAAAAADGRRAARSSAAKARAKARPVLAFILVKKLPRAEFYAHYIRSPLPAQDIHRTGLRAPQTAGRPASFSRPRSRLGRHAPPTIRGSAAPDGAAHYPAVRSILRAAPPPDGALSVSSRLPYSTSLTSPTLLHRSARTPALPDLTGREECMTNTSKLHE